MPSPRRGRTLMDEAEARGASQELKKKIES
jgi:hypothetical protein